MKKNYENVEINVISLEEEDVITASAPVLAALNTALFGSLNLGDLGHQDF